MTWPKRYGGGERSFLERYTVTEELLAPGAPVGCHWIADRQSGPLLLRYGSDEQRETFSARHLPRRNLFRDRHERAGFGLRPRLDPHPRDPGLRRLRGDRREGVDELRARVALRDHAGAHRYARPEKPPCRADAADRRSEGAGGDDPADPQSRRRARFQRDRPRPRLRAERAAGRTRGRRLASGDQRTRLRAQRPGAVSVVNAGAGRVGRARRRRPRPGACRSAWPHRRRICGRCGRCRCRLPACCKPAKPRTSKLPW